MLNKPPASSLLLIVMLASLLHSVIWCGDLTMMTLRSLNNSLTVYINDITPLLLLLLLLLFCCSSGILVSCYCLHYTMVRETVLSIKYCCWFCLPSVHKVHILLKWFMHYHYMVCLTTQHPFNLWLQVYLSYFQRLCVYCALECVILHAMIHQDSSSMLTR